MANDSGFISKLEQWFVDTLAALTYNSAKVFITAAVWSHQVGPFSGGMEAFTRFQPFAFVSRGDVDSAREGDYDLRQVVDIIILIGVESVADGIARYGDADHLGTNKIRDLVIAAFDKKHPGATIACDEIYYVGEMEVLDMPRRHALEMRFEANFMTV
jgi:hypothetical protein